MSISPPSSENRFWPTYCVCRNFSNSSASCSFMRMRRFCRRSKLGRLRLGSIRSCEPARGLGESGCACTRRRSCGSTSPAARRAGRGGGPGRRCRRTSSRQRSCRGRRRRGRSVRARGAGEAAGGAVASGSMWASRCPAWRYQKTSRTTPVWSRRSAFERGASVADIPSGSRPANCIPAKKACQVGSTDSGFSRHRRNISSVSSPFSLNIREAPCAGRERVAGYRYS